MYLIQFIMCTVYGENVLSKNISIVEIICIAVVCCWKWLFKIFVFDFIRPYVRQKLVHSDSRFESIRFRKRPFDSTVTVLFQSALDVLIVIIIIIFVYLIADITRNNYYSNNIRHAGQHYIQKG